MTRDGARPISETLQAGDSHSQRRLLWVAWGAVAIGLLLRLGAARGDLWMDEIWSLQLASSARSPLDVLWTLHHDNNNYLNTLWLLAVGGDGPPIVPRLLAVLSGVGVVALALAAPLRLGRGEAAATAILLAGSRLMVHYGSEARGYGPVMFFALASFVSLDRHLETGRRRWALAFAAAASLGVLSHLTFLFVLAGAFVWAAVELARRRRARIADVALLAIPAALLGFLWVVDVRFLAVGGAPHSELANALRELLRVTFGLPRGPLESLAVIFVAAAGYELFSLARARDGRIVFFAALFLAPVVSLLVWHPDYAAPRHFAVLVPLTLALVGAGLCRIARLGRWGRAVSALSLAVFILGNAVQIGSLLRDGRGHYRDAVELMLARSAGATVTVGGLSDFRNRMVLEDQARRLGASDRIVYVERARLAEHPPEWLLLIDFAERPAAMQLVEVAGRRYALAAVAPYAGLSGWSWLVYRAIQPPPS
jgi:hypothetical protein